MPPQTTMKQKKNKNKNRQTGYAGKREPNL